MKNNKIKKLFIATSLSAALVATAGFGTYSWFTSETSAEGEMVNGVLELNNGENIAEPLFEEENFSPSQLQYGNWVSLSNTGDLDTHLKATYTHEIDKASLEAYEIGYMAMKYKVEPGQDEQKDAEIALDNLFDGTTNERVAMFNTSDDVEVYGELLPQDVNNSGEIVLGEGSEDSFWELDEGEYIDIMIGVKMDESAGNEYQGAIYSSNLEVIAKQTDDGAQYE